MYDLWFGLWAMAKFIRQNCALSAKTTGKPDCGDYGLNKFFCKQIIVTIG
jgi:hypothetical protein